jgi:hypothetical protein
LLKEKIVRRIGEDVSCSGARSRTGTIGAHSALARLPCCEADDLDCNWIWDAYECAVTCCGTDLIGYVMDRFSTSFDVRHEGLH